VIEAHLSGRIHVGLEGSDELAAVEDLAERLETT
jgi:hypothetical protein